MKKFYKIDNIFSTITGVLKNCMPCQLNKHNNKKYGKLEGHLEAHEFNDMVAIDILGPIDSDEFRTRWNPNKFYCLNMIDACTRWVKVDVLTEINAYSIIKSLIKSWFNKFGVPKKYFQIKSASQPKKK